VLTVSCKSTRGIVAAISSYLADRGCNIIDSSQFYDLDTGKFFMRVSFISEEGFSGADIERAVAFTLGEMRAESIPFLML
ncbi:ACT domain-containing protein, partial [Rhizobium leguminosarum]|uniref:ACT domain-containing protein n=1 Tax=Rhizobium leguminosarum TaxID=384 RepID=UPI003F9DCD78